MTKFDFVATALHGVTEPPEPWKRAISIMNRDIGELIGELYVERHFKHEAKERMDTMIQNLLKSYDHSIRELDWMGEQTREKALEKLWKINTKIGFPDKWTDYSELEIVEHSLITNTRNAANFSNYKAVSELDKPVDKSKWHMNPQTVNGKHSAWTITPPIPNLLSFLTPLTTTATTTTQ